MTAPIDAPEHAEAYYPLVVGDFRNDEHRNLLEVQSHPVRAVTAGRIRIVAGEPVSLTSDDTEALWRAFCEAAETLAASNDAANKRWLELIEKAYRGEANH